MPGTPMKGMNQRLGLVHVGQCSVGEADLGHRAVGQIGLVAAVAISDI